MDILLFPPVAFVISLLVVLIFGELASVLEFKPGPAAPGGKNKPYACGEDVPAEKAVPDYQQFFPFAIFFTLLHVAGLVLATWSFNPFSAGIEFAVAYVLAVAAILAVLFVG